MSMRIGDLGGVGDRGISVRSIGDIGIGVGDLGGVGDNGTEILDSSV